MSKKASLILAMLLIASFGALFRVTVVKVAAELRLVPTPQYPTIQAAINASNDGDTVFVYNGTYVNQTIFIENKKISLVGQDPLDTILDGNKTAFPIIRISNTSDVIVSGFTVRNTTAFSESYGILMNKARNVTIRDVIVTEAYYGILLRSSNQCRVLDNRLISNHVAGIVFRDNSSNNAIVGNLISNNPSGIYIESYSEYNEFYRNNIINNTSQFTIFPPTYTSWNNGAEGNFWSGYTGQDDGSGGRNAGDGIGDTNPPYDNVALYPFLGVERYPLMEPWSETRTYNVTVYQVTVSCNFTVASFEFANVQKRIQFYITGPAGWKGYCNVTIPKGLLDPIAPEKWLVMFGNTSVPFTNQTVETSSTLISFRYTQGASMAENRVRIIAGTLNPPTASFTFTPNPASILEPVNFTDASSPNETIVSREWSFGDGTPSVTNETLVSHQFGAKESFNVTLTVRDYNDNTDSVTMPVWILNLEPSANFTFSPIETFVGLEVTFNATDSHDLDGIIVQYRWNFGDGAAVSVTPVIVHSFAHATLYPYKVNLTVIDDNGGAGSIARLITVGKGPTSMEVNSASNVKVREPFAVNATLKDYSSQPLLDEQIQFYVYSDDVVLRKNVTTGLGGLATTIFTVDSFGDYTINATYRGSDDYLGSSSMSSVNVSLLNTALTLEGPSNATQNEAFTMSATLVDELENPLYNVTVGFYSGNGSAWEFLGSSKTNQDGVSMFEYIPSKTGTLMLKAVFDGTEAYASSNGEDSTLVTEPKADYTLYIILAVILVAILCAAIVIMRRKAKPKARSKS